MTPGTNSTEPQQDNPFNEYTPALVKCLTMMSLGYLSGRFRVLSPSDAEGINKFASYWALPSLMYLTVATHDPSTIRWTLISVILIGKTIVFAVVIIFCIILKLQRKRTTACFYGAFYTVTNDAGLGNVIVQGLCAKKCSDMPVHLFYIQPLSMMLIHSLAFAVMTTDNVDNFRRRRLFKDSFKAIWTVAKNPLILAFAAGLITSNSSLSHPLPYYLRYVLNVLVSAFPANVLFLLGISMVGKFQVLFSTCSSNYVSWIPLISFFIKMMATPVLLYVIITNFPNIEKRDSNFAFLYGVMAPSTQALPIAKQYGFETDSIASTLTLSNLAFLPLSYLAAKAAFANLDECREIMRMFLLCVSVASLLFGLLTNVLMYWRKRNLDTSRNVVMWLSVCQMTLALGVIVAFYFKNWTLIIDINRVLVFAGQVTCHVFTAALTVFLYLVKKKFVIKKTTYLLVVVFGIPALLTACVLLFSVYLPPDKLPFTLAYDRKWLIVNAIATGFSVIVSVIFLCLHFRNRDSTASVEDGPDTPQQNIYAISVNGETSPQLHHLKNRREQRIESDRNSCSQRQYESQDRLPQFLPSSYSNEDLFGFLVLLCALMIQTFTAQLFKLTSGASSSIFIAIEFLSSVGNFGQGIGTFLWFGVNIQSTIHFIKQRWRMMVEFLYLRLVSTFQRRSRKINVSS